MIILGIDPGLARTGYAILTTEKNEFTNIVFGCIVTPKNTALEKRLGTIHNNLEKIIKKYKPEKVAIEQLFWGKNVKTALLVGQARGVICLAAAKNKLPVYEFTPLQVKQVLTGYGQADKNQVQQMLKAIFSLKKIPRPDDAADALAIAYCCLQNKSFT
ncbi:MAG: crossover junction endodeoxyribonuclease RuvC [Patescibacteria group bacterium]